MKWNDWIKINYLGSGPHAEGTHKSDGSDALIQDAQLQTHNSSKKYSNFNHQRLVQVFEAQVVLLTDGIAILDQNFQWFASSISMSHVHDTIRSHNISNVDCGSAVPIPTLPQKIHDTESLPQIHKVHAPNNLKVHVQDTAIFQDTATFQDTPRIWDGLLVHIPTFQLL